MNFFLDTNTCIYFLNGTCPEISQQLSHLAPSAVKIPSMVKGELLFGAEKSSRKQNVLELVTEFLEPFEIVPFCSESSEIYARIRARLEIKGSIIGPNDLIIAATVLAHNGCLVTANVREFARITELNTADWTKKD